MNAPRPSPHVPRVVDEVQVVQVDIDHRRLGLVKDVDVAVHGDAKLAAADLTRRLGAVPLVSASSKPERFETLTQRKVPVHAPPAD